MPPPKDSDLPSPECQTTVARIPAKLKPQLCVVETPRIIKQNIRQPIKLAQLPPFTLGLIAGILGERCP